VHTLPLPDLTDNNLSTKGESGNSKAGCALNVPRVSNSDRRVSADSCHLTPQQLQFLLRVAPSALKSQSEDGIPACITIAQAILESATVAGWGSSVLFRIANNPFGIKYERFGASGQVIGRPTDREIGRSGDRVSNGANPSPDHGISSSTPSSLPTGEQEAAKHQIIGSPRQPTKAGEQGRTDEPTTGSPDHPITRSSDHPIPEPYGAFDATTWEIVNGQKKVVIAQFQRFPNLDEAFYAHALLLRSARYRPAFAVRDDWKQFAERLGPKTSLLDSEHCGYSTNPSYSAELIKLVGLYRLDDPRAVQWFATGKDPGHRAIEPSDHLAIGKEIDRSAHEPRKTSAASNQ
jgi:flagellum-specific peptidoglycan hydrolase FlgJ